MFVIRIVIKFKAVDSKVEFFNLDHHILVYCNFLIQFFAQLPNRAFTADPVLFFLSITQTELLF